ncbi:restriction endonuclease subunit S [Thauera humireducens]
MTGKRKGIGLFGDCQSTNLRTVNHYFPQIARRTKVKGGKRLPTGWFVIERVTGHPYLRVTDMRQGGVDLADIRYVPPEAFEPIKNYRIWTSDLFISVAGTLGLVGRIPDAINGANLTENADRITEIECDQDYLLYQLLSERIQTTIEAERTIGAQPKLALNRIENFLIALPDTHVEQRAIATALSDVDALLTQLDRLIAKKRDIKQASMQQLLTGKTRLPGFDGEWRRGSVGDVVEALEAGVSVNSLDDPPTPGAPSVLKTSAVSAGKFLPEECKRITAADIPRARINPLANTILISRMNTPDLVGEVAYVPVNHRWLFLPDRLWMTHFKPGARVDARWLAYLLSSRAYQQQIKATATGTSGSMKNISKDSLLSIPVPFPEHEEQTAIATLLSDLDAELAALEARRDKTRALKQG